MGDLALIILVNNSINNITSERYTQFSALVCDCFVISFREVFCLCYVSGCLGFEFQMVERTSQGF